MAGRCDFPRYGDVKVFTFPKGVEVLGPRQIEARIDQDAEMSQALSLWGQRGSEVIRGNLLAVPLFNENTIYILFAEPIFLQAENAQLPEIKRIALADQNRVVWASRFDQALSRLLGREQSVEREAGPAQKAAASKKPEPISISLRMFLVIYRIKTNNKMGLSKNSMFLEVPNIIR